MLKTKSQNIDKEKMRPYILPGILVFFLVLTGALLVPPKISQIINIRKDLKIDNQKLAQLTEKRNSLESFNYETLVEKADLTTKILPSDKDLSPHLAALKALGDQNNVEILSLEVSPGEVASQSAQGQKELPAEKSKTKEGLPYLAFEIETRSQATDLRQFLSKLEKTAPLMRVEEIVIKSGEEGDYFLTEILLNSPYLFLPKTLGLPEKPLEPISHEEERLYQEELSGYDFSLIRKEFPLIPGGKEDPFSF